MNKTLPKNGEDPIRGWSAAHGILLGLTLLLALWIRLDDLIAWHHMPQKAFLDDRPLLTSFDGYFYLSLARDLQQGTYTAKDHLRGVPDPARRPLRPPLLSLFSAHISSLSGVSLDWVGVLLPPLLGVLLAIPLYLLGRLYGGPLMALVATFVGLCSSYYVYRSNLGWFDTDCMNATFAFIITYLFIQFGRTTGRRRFGYLGGGCACTVLFLLWWDQSAVPVIIIALSPLIIVTALYYRPKGKELGISVGGAALVVVALLIWQGPQFPTTFFKKGTSLFSYIAKEQAGAFPNIGSSVFEQKPLDFGDLISKTTGSLPVFCIGIIGLGWLFWDRKREAAALVVLFFLGCFSFLFARRFLIFFNPFIAIGVGFLSQKSWDLRVRWPALRTAAPAVAAVACLATASGSLMKVYWPKEIPPIVQGMESLKHFSPDTSVVWAWWDHGYPLVYWAQRATVNDGSLHSGLRTVCNAIPLTSSSQRYAAAFMHFYVARGTTGILSLIEALGSPAQAMALIEDVLTAGPQGADPLISVAGLAPLSRWHHFFFPQQQRSLYLFLDLRLARTTYWWHWFGTWDIGSGDGRHAKFRLIRGLTARGEHIQGEAIDVDLEKGTVTYKQETYPLSRYILNNGAGITERDYEAADGVVFCFRQDVGVGALMERSFSKTVFNQLFLMAGGPSPAFSLAEEHHPYYQIWKVTPPEGVHLK